MTMFLGLFGGLALFLFGMRSMSEGLQNVAGSRMQTILKRVTGIPIFGILVGTLITFIIQSSSATTVMVISFVNAGLMNLTQAIGVIMGANIGTTITAQLIAFKLTDFFMPLIAVGFFISFLVKKPSIKYLGQFLFGFGVLLMGLYLMSDAMEPLRDMPAFQDFIISYGNIAIVGVLIGALMTVIIQSSSAAMGILIALSFNELIPLDTAIAVILGLNIGTCVTTIIASIGTNYAAKRSALAHLIFNVLGAILCLAMLPLFEKLILYITPSDHMPQLIANAHTVFNIMNMIIFLPFIRLLAKLVTRIMPGEDRILSTVPLFLDERMLKTPSAAINLAAQEILHMGDIAMETYNLAIEHLINRDTKGAAEVFRYEKVIDDLTKEITEYLAKISRHQLTEELSEEYILLHNVVNDIERVGDHAENIAEMTMVLAQNDECFSGQAIADLREMSSLVGDTLKMSLHALASRDTELVEGILKNEEAIDNMEQVFRIRHIARLSDGLCRPYPGIVFLDVNSNLERSGDHAANIARLVKGITI